MDRFKEMELLVQVAETGSISKAAEALEISISAASRYLASLENRIGTSLIHRSTRRLSLTAAGSDFVLRSRAILGDLREAEALASDAVAKPGGLLRVTASLSFCLLHIEPLLPAFMARYPDITIDIVAENRYYNIIDNSVDVAVRTRQFEADSDITIRRLAATRRVLAATPAYLAEHGTPTHPRDLSAHRMIIYDHAITPTELTFTRNDERHVEAVRPHFRTNDGQIVRKAALDHMGILVQPKYIVHDDIRDGLLVPVIDDWDLPRLTMNIAFQTRRHIPTKVRLFVEALIDRFRTNHLEALWTA